MRTTASPLFAFEDRLDLETNLEALAERVLSGLCATVDARTGALYAPPGGGDARLSLLAACGRARRLPQRLGSGDIPSRAASVGRPLEAVWLASWDTRVRCELHVPLLDGRRVVGVASLGAARPIMSFDRRALADLAIEAAPPLARLLGLRAAERLAALSKAVLDATTDAICMVDADGRIAIANAEMEALEPVLAPGADGTFYERAIAVADRLADPDVYAERLRELADDPLAAGMDELRLADGSRCYERYTAPVREVAGAIAGRLFVLRDVTAAEKADRVKDELLATVSHELRTPLAGIVGFAELLRSADLDPERRDRYVALLHREADRLSSLVDDFLQLERLESGHHELKRETVRIDELLRAETEPFAAQSEAHSLIVDAPAGLSVEADRDRLAQVVANLLSNAVKYSPDGGVVRARARRDDGCIRVTVEDEGLGIPAGQQGHVFERFFRADSSDTREIGGTGLGLALVREIVEAHGGHVGFRSVERKGSAFWFELPAA